MAYDKHEWTDGEIITKERLNAIEDGIEEAEKQPGPSGKDAPTITGCTINIDADQKTVSGQLTLSEGGPISISGTYTAAGGA